MDKTPTPTNAKDFYCSYCDFKCSKQSDWDRHIVRPKHTTNVKGYVNDDKNAKKHQKTPKNEENHMKCHCGKIYKYYSGLWRHQNTCVTKESIENTSVKNEVVEKSSDNQQLLEYLIKQNSDLQKQILDICKNGIMNNTTNNINSNNKTFNLQVFLLENCKDAMNLSEFLESIKIQLADVEAVGELGYVNGISKLIIQNLKGLDVTKRPIHCTDEKREIIYIKEAGVWTKDEDYSKLRRLIKTVSNRNFKHTRLYKEKHPDCITAESKYSDTYNKIIIEATGGGSKCNDYESENKIMKKIAKAITIDKSAFLTNA